MSCRSFDDDEGINEVAAVDDDFVMLMLFENKFSSLKFSSFSLKFSMKNLRKQFQQ